MTKYRFLLDRDVSKVASLFPRSRAMTLAAAGLSETASDERIVEEACRREWIIVTANGDDFLRAIQKFLGQTKMKDCHDLRGLVILPSGYETQKRRLMHIEEQLRYGTAKISWFDVWDRSYCVRIKKVGHPEVRPLPRCFYCRKLELR